MKRVFVFCLILTLCMTVAGCRSAGMVPPAGNTEPSSEANETTGDVTLPQLPEEGDEIVGTNLIFSDVHTQRIGYSGLRSNVVYVTSTAQLPKLEVFAKYDAEFFREHALVLVTDTVGSGSVRVGIERITVSGNTAYVTVSRNLPGEVGTSDMATWYIWAEVETGLSLQWKVTNPVHSQKGNKQVTS